MGRFKEVTKIAEETLWER